jgi:hypothetical protein
VRFLVLFSILLAAIASQPLRAAPPASRPLVAVIDSGIARTAELAPWLVAEYDMAGTGRAAFQPAYDHGTMVATILLRATRRPVDIVSLRIDDPAGCPADVNPPCQPSGAPIAAAIRKATSLGVDAINISLALKEDAEIAEALRDAAAHQVRIVLAAGNDGLDHPGNLGMARAAYPNSVLVGALDAAGNVWRGTNRPGKAPLAYNYAWQTGVAVPTVMADGSAGWATGTSFAAPIETGRLLSGTDPFAAGSAGSLTTALR